MRRLLVGCPVLRREWIIGAWAEHAVTAAWRAGMNAELVVVAGVDDPTVPALRAAATVPVHHVVVDEPRTARGRNWHGENTPGSGLTRFDRMVELRNTLLGAVRAETPDLFLSLDSDVLAHPDAIVHMARLVDDGYAAAGGACFLSATGFSAANYARFNRRGNLHRPWKPGVAIRVDVLAAVKLMTPAAFHVDYGHHRQGEDVGWSNAVGARGLRLAWTSEVVSRHVWDEAALSRRDPRVSDPLDWPVGALAAVAKAPS